MNDIHNAQSTTEELIVAYLDGELVRKELEIELFDRLATAPEARGLLREHLVMRGAIKQSMTDDRFLLSDDLDTRTRARLEQILTNVTSPLVLDAVKGKRLADAPAVSHNATERRLQQWSKRPVALALLLLLAVGSTWYLTRASIEGSQTQIAQQTNTETVSPSVTADVSAPEVTAPATSTATVAAANTPEQKPKVVVRNVIQKVYVDRPVKQIAQSDNSVTDQDVKATTSHRDPADMMPSNRTKNAIKKMNTIVITEQDRI